MSSETLEETVVSVDGVAEADESMSWPPSHELASVWEESSDVRRSLRQNGKLLVWPKPHLTGVATVEALRANRVAINDALKVWANHTQGSSMPKSPPVDWLREEACQLLGYKHMSQVYLLISPCPIWKKIVRSNTACAHSYVQWAFHILLLRQVQQIYVLMNVECKMCNLHLDSWGVKRLVSLCLRRFRRDIVTFRDPELLFMDISFILADIVSVL